MHFLLSQSDIAFYLRTKCCVKFYTEKNANMYYKLSDLVIKNIFVQSKLFALNFASKYITDVILLVRLEISIWYSSFDVNPIQDGHFWGCSRMGGKKAHLPNICHTYPTMMKLFRVIPYLKKIRKIYELRDSPPDFCWHQEFFTGSQQIYLYQEIQI